MRHLKPLDELIQAIEEFGFAIGEAQDFIEREEPNFCELVDGVAFGELTSAEARFKIHETFAKARADIGQWAQVRAEVATQGGFPYLHESLRVGRVVAVIPDGAA